MSRKRAERLANAWMIAFGRSVHAHTSLMPCKIVTFRAADALSWCVRNVDCSGGKRKLRWEVNPTELSVVSVDEAAGIGRFSISCDDAKEHGEQVVTFCPPADLMRFVSSLKSLAAVRPPANTRASRKVHPLKLSPYFSSNMEIFEDGHGEPDDARRA